MFLFVLGQYRATIDRGLIQGILWEPLTDWLCDEFGEDVLLVLFGNGGNDGRQRRHVADLVLLGEFAAQRVQVDVLPGRAGVSRASEVVFDKGIGDLGAAAQEALTLGRLLCLGCCGGRHRVRMDRDTVKSSLVVV
jgi:hypothetical protein